MPGRFPTACTRHPVTLPDGTPHEGTVFPSAVIDQPRMEIGDYSYASAHRPPADWDADWAAYLAPILTISAPSGW